MSPLTHPEKKRRKNICCGTLFLIMALAITGCGLKSNPRPPQSTLASPVQHISVERTSEGALLQGTATTGANTSFRQERAELEPACLSYPLKYELVAAPTGAEVRIHESPDTSRYVERGVKKAAACRWRIRSCHERGRCGEAVIAQDQTPRSR